MQTVRKGKENVGACVGGLQEMGKRRGGKLARRTTLGAGGGREGRMVDKRTRGGKKERKRKGKGGKGLWRE